MSSSSKKLWRFHGQNVRVSAPVISTIAFREWLREGVMERLWSSLLVSLIAGLVFVQPTWAGPTGCPSIETWGQLRMLGYGSIQQIAYRPTGDKIAVASSIGAVVIWDIQSQEVERVLSGHASSVQAVAWSPDSSRIVSASSSLRVLPAQAARPCAAQSLSASAIIPNHFRAAAGPCCPQVR